MALTKLTTDLNIIAPLDNEPNDVGGLTSTQLKAKFDESGNAIKTYINETLTPELDAGFATKAEVLGITLGQIPDGSLTQAKLDTTLNAKINGAVSAADVYSKPETLSDATRTTLGLPITAVPDDAFSKLKTLVDVAQTAANGKAQIATGSYTGTGTSGSSNPNSLTFPFVPKIVFMRGADGGNIPFPYFWGTGSFYLDIGGSSSRGVTANASGKTLQWYEGYATTQLNESGKTYYWLAIS